MAEDNEIFIEDDYIALEDTDNSVEFDADTSKIIPYVRERFQRSEDYRRQDEERWLRSYRNYRGLYSPDVQFTDAEKSRVFIKVTKTKTKVEAIFDLSCNYLKYYNCHLLFASSLVRVMKMLLVVKMMQVFY